MVITLACISIAFAAASHSIYLTGSEYYGQPQPFLNVTATQGGGSGLSSAFLVDAVSVYMCVVYLILGFISCLYGVQYVDQSEKSYTRYCSLMLMLVGSLVAATLSADFLTLFIFWEISAASSYILVIYGKTADTLEASFKFLVMVIMASAFVVYGLSLVYGIAGSLNFWAVRGVLMELQDKGLLITAFAFIIAGFAVETAIVPFHMWLPDAYTAAPASSSALLSAVMDQASYYILIRILIYVLTPPAIIDWPTALAVFSAVTMTVGNLFALAQSNVKRMISYVCIADIGYNLVAITSVTPLGVMGNLFFFLVGGTTTALAFMCIGILNRLGLENLDDFSGVGRILPKTSLALTVAALSFPGLPSLAGFIAKYMVFTAAIEAGMWWLAVIGVLNSVIETAYFLRLIQYMFFKKQTRTIKAKEPWTLLAPVYTLVAVVIILGIYPTLALLLINPATAQIPIP